MLWPVSIRAARRRRVLRPLFVLTLLSPLLASKPGPDPDVRATEGSEGPAAGDDAPDPPRSSAPPNPPGTADPFADPPPRDPNHAPFLPPPNNQLGQWSAGRTPPLTRGFDDDHWVQLTAIPTYAAVHVPFIGRPSTPMRGGGVALELDVRLLPWLFVRVQGSHTLHPAFRETSFDEDAGDSSLTAAAGIVHATNVGGSLVYGLDIGRFIPRLDIGAGAMFIRSPRAVQAGQWGGECRDDGSCDLGLSCSAEEVCRPSPVPEFHVGVGFDVLFGRHLALGLALRYYGLLSGLGSLPFYVHGSARVAVRF